MMSACAPHQWSEQADYASFYGDFERSLQRHEDLMLSGYGRVAPRAEVSLDALNQRGVVELRQALERGDWSAACLAAFQLEQRSPDEGDLALIMERVSSHIKVALQRGAWLAFKSERSPSRDWERALTSIAHCPLEVTHAQLHLTRQELIHALVELSLNVYQARQIAPLDVYLSQLNARLGATELDSSMYRLSRARDIIWGEWRRIWADHALNRASRGEWGGALVSRRLGDDLPAHMYLEPPDHITATRSSMNLSHLSHLSHELWESRADHALEQLLRAQVSVDVSALSREVSHSLLTQTVELDVSRAEPLLGSVRALMDVERNAHQERWSIQEIKADCEVEVRQTKRERRDLAQQRKITSPKYKRALKRVEEQQAVLEAAQSQHEKLSDSLSRAHEQLQVVFKELSHLKTGLEERRRELKELAAHHPKLVTRLEEVISSEVISLPEPDDIARIAELNTAFDELYSREDQLKLQVEIKAEAERERAQKLSIRRDEVTRLSQYLTRTDAEVKRASELLEQRETELKSTPEFELEDSYSVFRYPAKEHHVTCQVSWEASRRGDRGWRQALTLTDVLTSHRAFPRYKLSAVEADTSTVKRGLLTRGRAQLARQVASWLEARRVQWLSALSERWGELSQQISHGVRLDLLSLLVSHAPDAFSGRLARHLSAESNFSDIPPRLGVQLSGAFSRP